MGLTTRQRWVLTLVVLTIAAFGAVDIWGDLMEGASVGHVATEAGGIVAGMMGVAWIWLQKERSQARSIGLERSLASANVEAADWRRKTHDLRRGLSQAIDEQLGAWSLTPAEKEVALLLLKGLSLKEIGDARGTSERTIRQQAQELYRKSGLGGRAEFAAFFLEDLLLPGSSEK